MYNHTEQMTEAVARRAVNNWPELQRAVHAERLCSAERLSVGAALQRAFSRAAAGGDPHPLEESFQRMLNFALGKENDLSCRK